MSNVVSFGTGRMLEAGKPDAALIEVIRDVLTMAEAGQITGLAGVAVDHTGSTYQFRAGQQNCPLVGRLEYLKLNIIREWDA